MKSIRARRIKIKVGEVWETPVLHVLLTKEDEVVVARCLDFTVSSHGDNEKDALNSLAESVKEYVVTAVENNAIETIFHPANGKYWRMYNELEAKQSMDHLKKSLMKPLKSTSVEELSSLSAEITYG